MAINCSISGGAPLFLVLQLIVHPFADAASAANAVVPPESLMTACST